MQPTNSQHRNNDKKKPRFRKIETLSSFTVFCNAGIPFSCRNYFRLKARPTLSFDISGFFSSVLKHSFLFYQLFAKDFLFFFIYYSDVVWTTKSSMRRKPEIQTSSRAHSLTRNYNKEMKRYWKQLRTTGLFFLSRTLRLVKYLICCFIWVGSINFPATSA